MSSDGNSLDTFWIFFHSLGHHIFLWINPKQGENSTKTQETTGSEGEWKNFRSHQKPHFKHVTKDKPLLLLDSNLSFI